MTHEKLQKLATQIIRDNIYLTLATADGLPWAAPVYYCVDDQFNFYFSSQLDSLHSQHILRNPSVAFAIFDSRAKEGTGNGVQGVGTARLLEQVEELEHALQYYSSSYVSCSVSDFDGSKQESSAWVSLFTGVFRCPPFRRWISRGMRIGIQSL